MKKTNPLKSKQKYSSNQLTFYFDTSEIILKPYGMENMQSEKKVSQQEEELTQKKRNAILSFAERKIIASKIKQGLSLASIARQLGRSNNSVIFEVRRNGGREGYDYLKADECSKNRQKRRLETISTKLLKKGTHPYHSLTERIENIEMQLEIIIETLKELKKCKTLE